MTLDGETIASVPRSIDYPETIALALLDVDAAPRHLGSSFVTPSAVDETRIGDTFVSGRIDGREVLGCGLERTNFKG